jgi:hypothetical protein
LTARGKSSTSTAATSPRWPSDGVANYEHKEGDKKTEGTGNNGEEIVGRIIYAKKIFNVSDCDTDREERYWDEVKVPFIYGMVRLYDGAGHSGAAALAAQIRDHHANNEPLLVRFSIEGSTLERDKDQPNRLALSVARRVALTLKPCNRTCASGLISDPKAPEGFDKQPETDRHVTRLIGRLVEKAETLPHPLYTKLGGVHEVEAQPLLDDDTSPRSSWWRQGVDAEGSHRRQLRRHRPQRSRRRLALQREDRGLRRAPWPRSATTARRSSTRPSSAPSPRPTCPRPTTTSSTTSPTSPRTTT